MPAKVLAPQRNKVRPLSNTLGRCGRNFKHHARTFRFVEILVGGTRLRWRIGGRMASHSPDLMRSNSQLNLLCWLSKGYWEVLLRQFVSHWTFGQQNHLVLGINFHSVLLTECPMPAHQNSVKIWLIVMWVVWICNGFICKEDKTKLNFFVWMLSLRTFVSIDNWNRGGGSERIDQFWHQQHDNQPTKEQPNQCT